MKNWKRAIPLLSLALAVALSVSSGSTWVKAAKRDKSTTEAAKPASGPVDLNSASQQELEALPGVGASTARKIIAGRPYGSPAELSKAGVSKKTIEKISPMVSASAGGAAVATAGNAPQATGNSMNSASKKAANAVTGGGSPVDINTASQAELEALPGVGPATAKKIIAGRPYSSVDGLSKAGVNKGTMTRITSMVKVSPVRETMAAPAKAPRATDNATGSAVPAVSAGAAGAAGMVWVNLDTKVYHHQGDHWYGNTKNGKYLSEKDALAAGYRASKQKVSGN